MDNRLYDYVEQIRPASFAGDFNAAGYLLQAHVNLRLALQTTGASEIYTASAEIVRERAGRYSHMRERGHHTSKLLQEERAIDEAIWRLTSEMRDRIQGGDIRIRLEADKIAHQPEKLAVRAALPIV